MKKVFVYFLATALVSSLTAFAVVKLTDKERGDYNENSATLPLRNVTLSDQLYPDFTFAAETAVKAVVHVKVTKKGMEQPFTIYDFFFGYGNPGMSPRNQVNSGSGVIITSDGYIITNNHVIEGADEIVVTLEDNKSYKSRLIGRDPVTDIALLKIDANNLPYLTFGNSDSLRLGEWVIAIGNPYNLRSTITAGIVSAKGRSMPATGEEFKIESFIQTDAAVNPGNSGGALVTTRGELVGINTAIATRTGSYTGYSFAVPSSIAKKVVEDLIDFGSVQRALLGISMQEIDGDLAKEKGLEGTNGIYIAEVVRDGAADRSGIKVGDVLLSINGVKVNSGPAVQEQISKYRPKDKVDIELLRNGKQISVSVVLQSKSGDDSKTDNTGNGVIKIFGAELKEAPKELLEKLSLKSGVEVLSVSEGKFRSTGIKKGFVITYVNQNQVSKAADISAIIQSSRRSVLIEGVYPDGTVVYYGMGL
ncbi:Do family serine endopeptidase [Bacteroidales bacterium MB20-C3-3]|jgi:Do/DeqQ family serine protease|nr:Do family serine endopeptidase [Bacteroidales bacterium]MBP8677247.1 Do family serine endopeptidase [Bacteroidales bacterium]MBP9977687.1 Do family serine endopeptidase [Bacteroidales bacterium]WRQ33247.1 Do family serine endopeptidase [Bacteroidales bacterium MB20-C3-3]